ncbi:mucin-5AC-like [Daphnia pulex]|uniref:mucin-5AC-like n=1 Tax=Daphnia pulex TaxID=6669 RepID=UPI001EDF922B|nr:mucin-5AC-like [Daphnia pulex]
MAATATSIRAPDDGQTVAFTQHFTSGPPSALVLKDDGEFDTMAIEKQEEWIKKRKVEQVTTKQIETRVKRQVVVNEDGQVLDDSGPQVTTRTTEDTETKREEHTEKTGGDGDGTVATLPPEGWVAIPGAVIVRETHEKKSNTRDEIDERLETEEVHHLGHLTNQELEEALEKQRETGQALTWRRRQSSVSGGSSGSESAERQLVAPYSTGKRVVHQSRKHKRIIDQENTEERSEEKDGRITTETKRHEHHEEIDDNEEPEDDRPASDTSSIHEVVKETRNNYTTLQDEDQVEYIAVPKGGHISGGVKLGHGPRQTTQKTVQYDGQGDVVDSARNGLYVAPEPQATPVVVAAAAAQQPNKLPAQAPVIPPQETAEQTAERTDALTKKPLDLEAEEETRKLETSRWLDSHFGSESSTDGGSANGSKIGLSGSKSGKKNKEKSKMPSQVSSGGINVTMKSDPSGSDRYDPLANEPMVTNSRIYSSTTGLNSFNRTTQQQQQQTTQQRIQSGPQSPSYNKLSTSPVYQTNLNNGKPELYRNLSAGDQEPIKRASSFNHTAGRATGIYSWMNKEELKGHQSNPLAARQSFLQSMNRTIPDKYQSPVQQSSSPPTYAAPVSQARRWPPPVKPIDDGPEDDMRTSTPVYQAPHQHQATPNRSGGTIIRLGPTVDYSTTNGRKPSNSGISRTQSLLTPSGSKQPFQDSSTPDRVYSSPVGNNIMNQQHNTTSRMNLLNSSLQSVPEREQRSSHYSPQPQGYFVDTERSFQSPNRSSGNPKVIQSYAIKTPPPRPAPPTSNHYGSPSSMYPTSGSNNKLRMTESFRSPKSPPMFAVEELASPPVRPVRRKQSKRINPTTVKTDSGTQCNPQTIRNDMIQQQQQYHSQTLDRSSSKPMKKYYMGEDPFTPSKGVVNGKVELEMSQPSKPARSEVTRSQTLPRRPSKQPLLSETSIHLNNSANISNNMSSSRVFSDQDRSLNETFPTEIGGLNQSGSNRPASSRIVAITPVKNIQNNNNNNPMSSNKNSSSSVTNLSSSTLAVNRSQSFQVGHNQSATTTTTPAAPAASSSLQQRRSSLLSSTPLRSVSIRSSNLNSPLYKSTSFLNRTSGAELSHQPFASLKSPGIVTSISKSQLDLNKSTTELNSFQPPPPQPYSNSALYTLPRRRSNAQPATNAPAATSAAINATTASSSKIPEPDAEWVRQPVDILGQPLQLAQTSSKVQTGISDRLVQLSSSPPKSPTIDDSPGSRGESYSSLHRRKMQAAAAAAVTTSSSSPATPPPPPPPPQPTIESQPMSFQSSTKSTHRSFRGVTNETIKEENEKGHEQPQTREQQQPEPELEPEARSLKDRIALLENAGIHYANPAQTLPRVVGGKTKAPPPPPAKTYHSPAQQQEPKPERMMMKEESPEVESIEKRQKFLEGLLNSAPELFMHIHGDENLKDIRVNREDVIDGKSPDARLPRTPSPPTQALGGFNNRVYTSTPVTGASKMNHPIPLTPPPLLIRNNSGGSPFGSQRDLLAPLRRGSLTLSNTGSIGSNGGVIIPAVKIPAPVNYSETVRIKSNQDPDSQSDSVQSYSKRVQPFVDGFSSETKSSSQQTTMSRSEYTTADRPNDSTSDIPRLSPSIYHSIRPQQSGGVIITVRGNGGQ